MGWRRWIAVAAAAVFVIGLWVGSWWLLARFGLSPKNDAGLLGDSFGAVNSLFSGLAFIGLVATLLLQIQELRENRDEWRGQRRALELAAMGEASSGIDRMITKIKNDIQKELQNLHYPPDSSFFRYEVEGRLKSFNEDVELIHKSEAARDRQRIALNQWEIDDSRLETATSQLNLARSYLKPGEPPSKEARKHFVEAIRQMETAELTKDTNNLREFQKALNQRSLAKSQITEVLIHTIDSGLPSLQRDREEWRRTAQAALEVAHSKFEEMKRLEIVHKEQRSAVEVALKKWDELKVDQEKIDQKLVRLARQAAEATDQ